MDSLELDHRALTATGRIIAGLTDDQLDAATPCAEWTVRDVIEHMIDNRTAFAALITGVKDIAAGDDIRERFSQTVRIVTAAINIDGALDRQFSLGQFGTYPGKIALRIYSVDTLVHGWDIGKAIGVDVELDEELATAGLKLVRLYPDTAEMRGPGGAFAQPQPVNDDAPAGIRLVAALGRSPAWPR